MKTYHYYLYVNGVHCMDKDIIAESEEEAVKKLKEEEKDSMKNLGEQYMLASVK